MGEGCRIVNLSTGLYFFLSTPLDSTCAVRFNNSKVVGNLMPFTSYTYWISASRIFLEQNTRGAEEKKGKGIALGKTLSGEGSA